VACRSSGYTFLCSPTLVLITDGAGHEGDNDKRYTHLACLYNFPALRHGRNGLEDGIATARGPSGTRSLRIELSACGKPFSDLFEGEGFLHPIS